jgi:methionyl-tRNA formyltransferase
MSEAAPRTVLICHVESRLNREAIARWLASFTHLVGIVLIAERRGYQATRIRREIKRIGVLRFLDVLAFRAYYAAVLAASDRRWLDGELRKAAARYPPVPQTTEVLVTDDPNASEVEQFLRRLAPDLVIARCKRILKPAIFAVPARGTFVMHPGVCPEYRNAHGAFWALARRDLGNVALTLLKVDAGIDTGPIYGYYTYAFDESRESHIVVMTRLALDNLERIKEKLLEICSGRATPLDTSGRRSATWGQPWLTSYLSWKWKARRTDASARA